LQVELNKGLQDDGVSRKEKKRNLHYFRKHQMKETHKAANTPMFVQEIKKRERLYIKHSFLSRSNQTREDERIFFFFFFLKSGASDIFSSKNWWWEKKKKKSNPNKNFSFWEMTGWRFC
jgi:hypothetical protein